MNLSTVWEIFTKLLDICLVWLAFYYILKNVKNIQLKQQVKEKFESRIEL